MKPSTWIALAALSTAALASAADFFPLRPGNSWTYRNSANGQTFTVNVGFTLVSLNDRTYYSLRGFTDQPVLVRLNDVRDLVAVDPDTYAEQTIVSFQPSGRDWWQAANRQCEQEGQTEDARGTHDGPSGPIEGVLEIHYRVFGCADVGVEQEQYAENIGMLRRIITTIAGPQTFDLIEAHVNKMQVGALPSGAFTITAKDAELAGDLSVTLKLTTPPAALTLDFPSGQEFDVALRDSTGQTLWKWSDGRFFTDALHSITINGGWTTTVKIPRSVLPSGDYILDGWLTTTGTRYGSSLPLTIP